MPILPATLTDVPHLNILVNEAYRGETSRQGWTTEANLLDGLRIDEGTLSGYLHDPNVVILKNTNEEEQITGCVYLELRPPKLYLGMFSVLPLLQGKGIGRNLLLAAEAYAQKLNVKCITMTVISTRHELINWYERRGYKVTGETLPFHVDKKFGIPKQLLSLIVMEKETYNYVPLK
jgi:ribosomal protein S18 acetylase RimI-like enzyme